MPTDAASIARLSKEISDLARTFEDSSNGDINVQQQIVLAAERLAIAAREPDENVYHTATQVLSR